MEVSHPDPVHAMYLARKMFEACRDEGYDEKNITIVCNKKTIPIHDTAKGKDKDGNETVEEKGLLKNEIAKAAIDTRAAAHQEARNANNKRLKDEIARNRPANTEKSVTEEIHDAAAARNGTTTIP